jgi:hypothetical protein
MEAAVLSVVPDMAKKLLGLKVRLKDRVAPASGSVPDRVPTTTFADPSCTNHCVRCNSGTAEGGVGPGGGGSYRHDRQPGIPLKTLSSSEPHCSAFIAFQRA